MAIDSRETVSSKENSAWVTRVKNEENAHIVNKVSKEIEVGRKLRGTSGRLGRLRLAVGFTVGRSFSSTSLQALSIVLLNARCNTRNRLGMRVRMRVRVSSALFVATQYTQRLFHYEERRKADENSQPTSQGQSINCKDH